MMAKTKAIPVIAQTLLRHALPIALTTLGIFMLWVMGTLPMIAVFVLDDAFTLSEYAKFLVYAFSASLGLSAFVFLPLALIGEKLAKKSKHAIWIYPGLPCLCIGIILIVRIIVLESLFDAFLSWTGYILLVSGLFVLYWAVLWFEKATLTYWQKRRKSRNQRL